MTVCRFAALIVDEPTQIEPSINRALRSGGLRCCFRSDRVVVMCDEERNTVSVGEGGGIIFGYLFKKGARSRRVTALLPSEAVRIRSSGGESLTREYWGGYAAIIVPPSGREVHVLRDPSGQITVFVRPIAQGFLICSDMAMMTRMGFPAPDVDWAGLANLLRLTSLPLNRTALTSISELHPGVRMTVSDRAVSSSLLWDPWRFVTSSRASMDEINHSLRTVIDDCVITWARCFDSILLSLSGGLDSSILAASLSSGSTRFTAINFADEGSSGDERPHARAVAARLRIPLQTWVLQADAVDVAKSGSLELPRPLGRMIGQSFDAGFHATLSKEPAEAVFDGVGGDNVFCFLQSPTPAADRLRAQGFGRGLTETIADVCAMSRCSIPNALTWMARKAWLSRTGYVWRNRTDLLLDASPRAWEASALSPWLAAPRGALPGKAAHVAMLLRAQVRGRSVGVLPRISPLLSQPLMEYCLSIPSWLWCAGGKDRAPLRRAYADSLPLDTVMRQGKGGAETLAVNIVRQNAGLLSDLLANGRLVSHRVIDGDAIKRALRPDAVARGTHFLRLLEFAEAEAWASSWDRSGSAAVSV